MIAVTGHTGHLGRELMRFLPTAIPLGRDIPQQPVQKPVHVLVHAAAPNWRDNHAVTLFDLYNETVAAYIRRNDIRTVINIGSWWQYAEGDCRDLPYTLQKHRQARLMEWTGARVTHVIPYSIYGDEPRAGRGFIPQLIDTLAGKSVIAGLSQQRRDFIHVTDVAAAVITAIDATPGTYVAATGFTISPAELAQLHGLTAPEYPEHPHAIPRHLHPSVPKWQPRVDVLQHITQRVGAAHPNEVSSKDSRTR